MAQWWEGWQGWRSGESTRLPPMWPGFDSRSRCHMWVEFVVGSRPCPERFFSGYSGFPLSSKTNISKFQFDLDTVDEEPSCGCAIICDMYLQCCLQANALVCHSTTVSDTLLALFVAFSFRFISLCWCCCWMRRTRKLPELPELWQQLKNQSRSYSYVR